MVYKWCAVPECKNTSIKAPDKNFVSVPTDPERRKKWLQLARRDPSSVLSHTNIFMCEDHFDMEKDTKNYMKYKMGFTQKIFLTDDAVPHKFHCQKDRKRRLSPQAGPSREAYLKRRINYSLAPVELEDIPRRSHITPFLNKSNILNMSNWRKLKLASMVFTQKLTGVPPYLARKLKWKQIREEKGMRAQSESISPPLYRIQEFRGSFRYVASKCWNNLPPPVRNNLPNPEDQQVTLKITAKSNQVQKRRKSLFKEDSLVNSKTSSHRLREQAPGPSGSSAETALPYPGDLGSNIQLIDPLAEPEPITPQCRFCGDVTEDCIDVIEDKPYLTKNKTTLILNNLSVELDFEDAPTTVCQGCDSKLIAMFDFVKQVKAAQESMNSVTVKEEVDVEVKTECESPTLDNNDEIMIESNVEDVYSENDTVDSLQVPETVVKPATKHKRKQVLVPKLHKKHKVIEDVDKPEKPKVIKDVDRLEITESDWIVDIKEETVEREDEHEVEYLEFSDTETDNNISNPSESELDTILKLMK